MKCHIVDVFAETRFAGNQLAVVLDCEHLSSDAMQDIAREMNFSETTFVIHQSEDEARVRIFSLERVSQCKKIFLPTHEASHVRCRSACKGGRQSG